MADRSADVVIMGGGIAGMTTAYYLAKSGVPSVVVERDAIGSHASGFAYGGLSPLSGFGIPGPLAEIAQDGMRLHRELSKSLLEETGIDVDFRVRSSLALALTEADVRRLQAALPWQQRQPGYAVRWLEIAEARRVEPRISSPSFYMAGATCPVRMREVPIFPGTTKSAFGTSHPPGTDSLSEGSFTTSCVEGPPSRFSAAEHPSPPLSGASARKRAKGVASALVETTRMITAPFGAYRRALGDLRLDPRDGASHHETRNTLDDHAMGQWILDVDAEDNARPLVVHDEGAPALPLAPGEESSSIDGQTHRAPLVIEEARIDGNRSGVGCRDLLDGAS
jgi:hypothetical protein